MKSILPSVTSEMAVKPQSWNLLWWILGTIFVPISVPYLIYQILGNLREKASRKSFPGKVVVITGASSGLGESLAHSFYKMGCKVVLTARRTSELERVRSELIESQTEDNKAPDPIIVSLDLTDINSLPIKVKEIIDAFGKIDILVNNGGISVRSDIISTTMDVDIKVMLVNYFGTVAMTKAVLPSMIKRKEGHIVCVSSVQGKFAIPHRSSYTASKHALQAFCDALRAEMDEHNVNVTVVSPGYINTSLSLNSLTGNGKAYGKMDSTTAGGVSPEQMADDILRAVLRQEEDVILAPIAPKAAYWLRFVCPTLYFWVMSRRAKKLSLNKDKQT